MLRYKLRTLLIVLALGPPLIAGAWWAWRLNRPEFDPAKLTGEEREAYWKAVNESFRREREERWARGEYLIEDRIEDSYP